MRNFNYKNTVDYTASSIISLSVQGITRSLWLLKTRAFFTAGAEPCGLWVVVHDDAKDTNVMLCLCDDTKLTHSNKLSDSFILVPEHRSQIFIIRYPLLLLLSQSKVEQSISYRYRRLSLHHGDSVCTPAAFTRRRCHSTSNDDCCLCRQSLLGGGKVWTCEYTWASHDVTSCCSQQQQQQEQEQQPAWRPKHESRQGPRYNLFGDCFSLVDTWRYFFFAVLSQSTGHGQRNGQWKRIACQQGPGEFASLRIAH